MGRQIAKAGTASGAGVAELRDRAYSALSGDVSSVSTAATARRQTSALLQRIQGQIEQVSAQSARDLGVHATDLAVLGLLHLMGIGSAMPSLALQKALNFTPGGMTRRLDAMQGAGLVERLPDPDDRRAWLVQATGRGEEVARAALDRLEPRSRRLEGSFSESEWQTLITLLDRFSTALNEPLP